MTQEVISARVGKSRVAITNTIRLLNLDERVLEYLKEGVITEGHGRALLALPTGDLQLRCARKPLMKDYQSEHWKVTSKIMTK